VASARAVVRRNRPLWIVAAVAVVSLTTGLAVGSFVISPADAAAKNAPPAPGFVTAPVESGPLSNDVTLRADFGYADPVEVKVDTAGLPGAAIVTGRVPEVGAQLDKLSIALEVAGRPVIVLPGDLPAYRALRFGVSGPDVSQFKAAMRAIGVDAGDPANAVFDEQATDAVTALYAQAGYPAPAITDEATSAVRSAEAAVGSAERQVASARTAYDTARAGATAVDEQQADNDVAAAQRALDAAMGQGADDSAVANLRDALSLAQAKRAQLDVPRDTTAARTDLESAQTQLESAQDDLARARERALPSLPAGEVLYLSHLPRRVDSVDAQRGTELKGTAMVVSGATLSLSGSAPESDGRLVTTGAKAQIDLPDGTSLDATVSEVAPAAKSGDRWKILLSPAAVTEQQRAELTGKNLRVRIPVASTAGDVLHVPLAALSAGPGGEDRVEVVSGDPSDPKSPTRLVVVETGLAASGAVEVRPVDGDLSPGDQVVVGR
jgi:multidrug efflux pump subunit AcrA (membrane-fusion protein)